MTYEFDVTNGSNIAWSRPIPVYDAAALAFGELLMRGGTDNDTDTDEGIALITAFNATQASQAALSVGILSESSYDANGTAPTGAVSPATVSATSQCPYGQVIVNMNACYKAEYLAGTSNDTAITSTSSTTLTIGSVTDDVYAGSWMYFPLSASTAQYYLRFIVDDATGSMTMDSALGASGTSSDTVINIVRINNYPHDIDTTAVGLDSDAFAGNEHGSNNLRVIENIIQDDIGRAPEYLGSSTTRTRGQDGPANNHRGLGPLDSTTKLFGQIVQLEHLYKTEG